jgi:hypothetical protein
VDDTLLRGINWLLLKRCFTSFLYTLVWKNQLQQVANDSH